ncbi:MAG: tRNA (N6-threonylcarbamoyladenosine(37)-N6)-methyltransferase TrmO [Dehalococcoidales bacterium]|nr:tRNA (N6-threonylcarbamoyladenosine(37)-N6)-methyltransferase TrmO [Dehalococcoidales bacterium]
MTEQNEELIIKPVGYVRSPVKESPVEDNWWQDLVSEIVIDESLVDALDQIDYFTYLVILYWIHKRDRMHIALRINPKGRMDIPMRGIFSTRTPDRINPIGMTAVRLLKCEGNVLTVQGLDALDGSPVIDIKPWNTGYDLIDEEQTAGE